MSMVKCTDCTARCERPEYCVMHRYCDFSRNETKWAWKMNWCRQNGVLPANGWNDAEEAWGQQ